MIADVFDFVVTVETEVHKEEDAWVASCPALNVASHGDSEAEARAMLLEALVGFFECCTETGVLHEALRKLGVVSVLPLTLAATEGATSAARIPERMRVPVNMLPPRHEHGAASETAVH